MAVLIQNMKTAYFNSKSVFPLESGEQLNELTIAYTTLGERNEDDSNIIWICHALTANSDPSEWWEELVGPYKTIDTTQYFVVCANVIGGCYGTTGPLSIDPETGHPYYHSFPNLTTRDLANAHELLRKALKIEKITLGIGGSLGGQQLLEWNVQHPERFENLILLATNAKHSPFGIAFNETQRMAIETDPTWNSNAENAGLKGLETARAIALLSYRSYASYSISQTDEDQTKRDLFKAGSYQRYQGYKLRNRFNAFSYFVLSKTMDSHNVGRNRESVESALRKITAKTLIIGISSDLLFPVSEQAFLERNIPNSNLVVIGSNYGHDGFLTETERLSAHFCQFLSQVDTNFELTSQCLELGYTTTN
jgi:homoserine O-acetyltransferase